MIKMIKVNVVTQTWNVEILTKRIWNTCVIDGHLVVAEILKHDDQRLLFAKAKRRN